MTDPRPAARRHAMSATRVVILGRDGVLNAYRDDHVKSPDEWVAVEGALEAVARLNHAGFHVVLATNQGGIGRGMIDMASVNAVHAHLIERLAAQGGRLDAIFFCPCSEHDEPCPCRKPLPGMPLQIAQRYGVEPASMPMVGDTLRDLLAAQAAGCEPHLVRSGRAAGLAPEAVERLVARVPGTQVHASLSAFADRMLARVEQPDSVLAPLAPAAPPR
jgi:D-glycero-D-manno-heptose 1,7-bisphosphate phosphatase